MKQRMWWMQFLGKYGLLDFVKHKNQIYAPVALQKLIYRLFIFLTIKLSTHSYLMHHLKEVNKIIDTIYLPAT